MECLTEYETRYGMPDGIPASSSAGFVTYKGSNVGDWESCRSICKSKGAEWWDWNKNLKKCFCKSQQYWEVCTRNRNGAVTSGETTCSSESNQPGKPGDHTHMTSATFSDFRNPFPSHPHWATDFNYKQNSHNLGYFVSLFGTPPPPPTKDVCSPVKSSNHLCHFQPSLPSLD